MSTDSAAKDAANASTSTPAGDAGKVSNASPTVKKPIKEQNPAFKAMGLPRLRLPSRNWMIFWIITGSIAGAITYDKWQTKRNREKWCNLVSHIAQEHLDTKTLPRKLTVYLAAPPGDGLRSAREHFHTFVKPILVAAAMDWDVVEGRKEGDVRHKTSERIRQRRKRNGEGEPVEEDDSTFTVEGLRAKSGNVEYPGVAGDIVVGRHTWKEYIRGIHEGYLGPADLPKEEEKGTEPIVEPKPVVDHTSGHSSLGDSAVKAAIQIVRPDVDPSSKHIADENAGQVSGIDEVTSTVEASEGESAQTAEEAEKPAEETPVEEKPKRRFPPSSILPEDYQTAQASPSTPETIGPVTVVRFPHLLGIMNTRIRLQRYLTRRNLQEEIGREVAAAVLAAHRPYGTVTVTDWDSPNPTPTDVPELREVLVAEERDWVKKVRESRQEHEESVFIEPMAFDDRIIGRVRAFQLTAEDEDRAKRIAAGKEQSKSSQEES